MTLSRLIGKCHSTGPLRSITDKVGNGLWDYAGCRSHHGPPGVAGPGVHLGQSS